MNTYTWKINVLECKPQEAGETDVVVTAHWSIDATDGEHNGSAYGTQSFNYDQSGDFTPFEDLTEEQVIGWVQDGMGEEAVIALEANLDKQIEDQIDPPIVTPPLPWAAPLEV